VGNFAWKSSAVAALTLASAMMPAAASAGWNFTVLHTFTGGSDGGYPVAGVTLDKFGNLYGTAASGGTGYGTAFELKNTAKGYAFEVLYSFAGGSDGAAPGARLMPGPDGRLYGTTAQGGGGGGTVFELGAREKGGSRLERDLFALFGGGNGYQPSDGDIAFDAKGDVFGTTTAGGAYGNGSVYELKRTKTGYTETAIYSFGAKQNDGSQPVGGLIFDAAGNLYGTTSQGGSGGGYGTVFQLVPGKSGWTENILYNFTGTSDASGNLYGGATDGGVNNGGTIYELSPGASGWKFAALYSVPGWGVSGPFRTPYVDASGNIWATTHCDGEYGAGSVYELTNSGGSWTYNSVHEFTGGSDGAYVFANPVFDGKGNIFGTTQVGGSGAGVVWEASPT